MDKRSLTDRILDKLEFRDECWIWTGTKSNGYGRVKIDDRLHYVHRVIYERDVGPIPDELQMDHLCRNRACCNPVHLEPVTASENVRRSNHRGAGWKMSEQGKRNISQAKKGRSNGLLGLKREPYKKHSAEINARKSLVMKESWARRKGVMLT